mgnify:FL=1|jgi:hypothetical protein
MVKMCRAYAEFFRDNTPLSVGYIFLLSLLLSGVSQYSELTEIVGIEELGTHVFLITFTLFFWVLCGLSTLVFLFYCLRDFSGFYGELSDGGLS